MDLKQEKFEHEAGNDEYNKFVLAGIGAKFTLAF